MTYTDKNLEEIEKLSSIYMKISDIAIMLDIPADVLREDIADRTSPASKAIVKVRLHLRLCFISNRWNWLVSVPLWLSIL